MSVKRSIKPLLIGSGLAALGAAAAGAASMAATNQLVRIALDRELPARFRENGRARERLTGSPADRAALYRLELAGKALRAKDVQTVRIYGRDGATLVGHWRPGKSPGRVILAMHGWRSSWHRDFGIVADFWYEHGCSVLFAEQRGQGSSGGEYMAFGMMERYDCLAWAQWLNRNVSATLPIYLAGVSMGATTVLMASALAMPPNVRGIVADCGFTSPRAIWQHVARNNLHLPYGPRAALVDALCKRKIHMASGDCSTVEALKKSRIPVLFVHGTDDRFVPVEMTYENYKACAAPKRLFVVPGADHGGSYLRDRKGYEQAILDFWRENDTKIV